MVEPKLPTQRNWQRATSLPGRVGSISQQMEIRGRSRSPSTSCKHAHRLHSWPETSKVQSFCSPSIHALSCAHRHQRARKHRVEKTQPHLGHHDVPQIDVRPHAAANSQDGCSAFWATQFFSRFVRLGTGTTVLYKPYPPTVVPRYGSGETRRGPNEYELIDGLRPLYRQRLLRTSEIRQEIADRTAGHAGPILYSYSIGQSLLLPRLSCIALV